MSDLIMTRALAFTLAGMLFVVGGQVEAGAAEIKVVSSGGFAAAFRELAPGFERMTGNKIVMEWGPSMGNTPEAIPQRLARGESIDVVIMVGDALGEMAERGQVRADSRVDLARSLIGVAVRAGAPKPDIGSVEAVKHALLDAKSIAYSDSASGVYVSTEMFPRLGIVDQVKGKSRMIPAEPVGMVVARGEAELGFQQVSELLPIQGITVVGPLPSELQKVTIFSAGIVATSKETAQAKALIAFLSAPTAAAAIIKSGLEPMSNAAQK